MFLFKFLGPNATVTKNMRKLTLPINTFAMVDAHAQSTFGYVKWQQPRLKLCGQFAL